MNALTLLLIEIVITGFFILLLHRLQNSLGSGALLIYLGCVQFYQTLLASSVYNEIIQGVIVSPGSAVLYTSTLFALLLFYHTKGINLTRNAIFGLVLANSFLSFFSTFVVKQLTVDPNTQNFMFLNEILNFDIIMFLVGTFILIFDLFLITIIYQFLNLKFERLNLGVRIILTLSFVSFLDSVLFYSLNFFSIGSIDLLYSNIIGKQIAVVLYSTMMYVYLVTTNSQKPSEKPKSLKEIFSAITFVDLQN